MKPLIMTILSLFMLIGCADGQDPFTDEDTMELWTYQEVHDSIGMRYGVRWKTRNPFDLGERCFSAQNLRARFGVGRTTGESDFNAIYPWSEIRRCNVKREGDQTLITYDDDPAFRLDGSNGDVFVRIPKFYVEKYEENGYEYRVVSGKGSTPHPAFIENGRELDAVYVSAFEGYIDEEGLLRSVANVIPTSNLTAQQFLDAAQRRGPQYTLYDMRTVDMLFTLIAVEFGSRNTGNIFGYGIADYKQPLEEEWEADGNIYYAQREEKHTNSICCKNQIRPIITVGSNICICKGNQQNILTFARLTNIEKSGRNTIYTFDGPAIDITRDCFIGNCAQSTNWIETCMAPHFSPTGRSNMMEKGFSPRERNAMRYRWMENLVGNVWHFLPDITFFNRQMYICSDMMNYRFACYDYPYEPFGELLTENKDNGSPEDKLHVNTWVSSLMTDSPMKGVAFGDAYSRSLTSKLGFGAYYYVQDGLNISVNGGGFDHRNRCNILTTRAWINQSFRWHLYGARLLFKDI